MQLYKRKHLFVPRRSCAGCGERIPKDSPRYRIYLSRCHAFVSFRRAIDRMREVSR